MYNRLVDHWKDRLSDSQQRLLRRFSQYMDRNSLWLAEVIEEDDFKAYYTNEAEWFCFGEREMNRLLDTLDRGQSIDWNEMEKEHRLEEKPAFIRATSD